MQTRARGNRATVVNRRSGCSSNNEEDAFKSCHPGSGFDDTIGLELDMS